MTRALFFSLLMVAQQASGWEVTSCKMTFETIGRPVIDYSKTERIAFRRRRESSADEVEIRRELRTSSTGIKVPSATESDFSPVGSWNSVWLTEIATGIVGTIVNVPLHFAAAIELHGDDFLVKPIAELVVLEGDIHPTRSRDVLCRNMMRCGNRGKVVERSHFAIVE